MSEEMPDRSRKRISVPAPPGPERGLGGPGRALVDASGLRLRGVPESLIYLYEAAAQEAWGQALGRMKAIGGVPGDRLPIALRLKHPLIDPRTITAVIGADGRFGTVEAKTPATLRNRLARHLVDRFAEA